MIEIPSIIQGKNGWQWTEDYAIGLNENLGLVDFWVAGFTQNRQCSHKLIWDTYNGKEPDPPLEVNLVPEPDNQYDPYAIGIRVPTLLDQDSQPTKLGYVPRRISKTLSLSLNQIAGSFLTEARANVYGKYYNCKITLQIGRQLQTNNSPSESRFLQILLEEIAPSPPTL